ncbi:helix-turn-helix domain-containing protein [Actinomadura rupiterrae]|uniref:helix-turn-helix domain-containing protein n=1 Tax=Actinomadura rupiterrae TaxID=559627 RepID=UPI003557C9CB
MERHGIHTTTKLIPLLVERGITLSASQVHRLVSGTPERLSLRVLAACCDIFGCTPADLIVVEVPMRARPAEGGEGACPHRGGCRAPAEQPRTWLLREVPRPRSSAGRVNGLA